MSRLADPRVLASVKDLSLSARNTVDGFLSGIHSSRVRGEGMEFSQYRSYQPGDDLRLLDWKMFARSDRYYVRESEVETSVSVRLLVDASASMDHEDSGVSKIEYARFLAACLTYLAVRQGDAAGLFVFRDGGLFSLPARNDRQHLTRIFHHLETIKPGGRFTQPAGYRDLFSGSGRRELLVFITDFHEQNGEIGRMLDALTDNRHEVIVFHLLGRNELELDYRGYDALEDLETGQTIRIDAGAQRALYVEKLQARLSAIRSQLLDRNVFYQAVCMDEPVEEALVGFLKRRNHR